MGMSNSLHPDTENLSIKEILDLELNSNETKLTVNQILDLEFNVVAQKRQELITSEIDKIIINQNRTEFLHYMQSVIEELNDLSRSKRHTDTFKECKITLNNILKQVIGDETTKWYLLSGTDTSEMYHLRESIVVDFFDFIDQDIIDLLSAHLEIEDSPETEEPKKPQNNISEEEIVNYLEDLDDLWDPNDDELDWISELDEDQWINKIS